MFVCGGAQVGVGTHPERRETSHPSWPPLGLIFGSPGYAGPTNTFVQENKKHIYIYICVVGIVWTLGMELYSLTP